ncbi:jg13462 [Pararge aegeria aegeria]|uniref:Jg13462 protein n=1 Tax=Pararge aegeria aegeria TaxID=348720 RepID=A0A8S4QUA1_9NEOP|nr:jg13462 [Pararge aegeria aegeria]
MIFLLLDTVAPVLSHIFNFSLSSGEFPKSWRKAHIIPIPKTKNPISFSQYRPISILPFLSKVLERIVHFQLNSFLVNNNILSPYQSGFRRGHSTVTALVKVCDDIRANMDNQLITILALLDFSNAFNTVDFDILLAILKSINISRGSY